MERRLYRKTADKMFGGVCAGLADYVGVSKGGLRFLALLAVMASGIFPGIFLYLLCVMLIPKDDTVKYNPNDQQYSQYKQHAQQHWAGPENHWAGQRHSQEKPFYPPPPPQSEDPTPTSETPAPEKSGNRMLGFVFVLLGVGVIARTYLTWIDPRYLLAGGLILIGAVMLFRKRDDV